MLVVKVKMVVRCKCLSGVVVVVKEKDEDQKPESKPSSVWETQTTNRERCKEERFTR